MPPKKNKIKRLSENFSFFFLLPPETEKIFHFTLACQQIAKSKGNGEIVKLEKE
jgi:hypothetical protein